MQVPLKWLRDYVDIDMDVNELADLLTMTGTKVEEFPKWEQSSKTLWPDT